MSFSPLRLCAVFLLLTMGVASAQEFRSTLSGRVLDSSGAAIPGIKVTATNNETGARFETTSTESGEYTLPFLAPGPYRLQAEAQGFKQYVQERIQIGTNTRVSQDITLEVGSQTRSGDRNSGCEPAADRDRVSRPSHRHAADRKSADERPYSADARAAFLRCHAEFGPAIHTSL